VKKIVLGLLSACLLVLVLLAVLLALAPWFINERAVKERIEAALTQTLGGPVTYERAALSIVPHLHVSITNSRFLLHGRLSGVVQSIDLNAAWRPLLTGTVRITAVRLGHPDVALTLSAGERPGVTPAFNLPPVSLLVAKGRLTITQNRQRLVAMQDLDMQIDALPPATQSRPAGAAPTELFHITGSMQGVISEAASLPGPVSFSVQRFDAIPRTLSFSDARVQLLDTPFVISGRLDDYLTTLQTVDLSLNGTVGPEMVQWIRTLTSLPPEMTLHPPVLLSHGRLVWHRDGTLGLKGTATVQNNVVVSFDVSRTPDRLTVQALEIRDAESKADLAFTLRKKTLILAFSGRLSQTTLNNLFEHERFQFGWIRGDLNARIALNRPSDSIAHGTLEGEGLLPPFTLKVPVIINRISLKAEGRIVTVNPLVITVGGKSHVVTGSATASADGWGIKLKSDGLEWEPLQALFAPGQATPSADQPAVPNVPSDNPQQPTEPVRITLRLDTAYFSAGGWTARPARAEIAFEPDGTRIRLDEATVCGIHLSGTATVQPANLALNIRTSAHRRPLASSLTCLTGKDLHITGTYDLSGAFTSRGETSAWLDHLRGTAAFETDVDMMYHQTTTNHRIKVNATLTADHWGIDLKSDGLEWEPLQALFAQDQEKTARPALPKPVMLRLDTDYFSAGGWTARPARAEIAFNPDTTRIRLNEASVCGIHLSGTATLQPANVELNLRTTASHLPLAPTLDCLSGKDLRITGTYSLSGAFTSSGEASRWLDHLRGSVSLTARDGHIYHDLAFIKALEYLNTTDLLKGKFPDPEREGVPYQTIDFRATVNHPILRIDQVIIVSPVADVTGRGSINLVDHTINSVYLIAPFPSADAVIKNIPLLKDILGGSLVTIPLQVKGPYKDPSVTALPPEQVADELGGMMKRILTLPYKLVSPFLRNIK
jgi:AsmA-like C-terminal region